MKAQYRSGGVGDYTHNDGQHCNRRRFRPV